MNEDKLKIARAAAGAYTNAALAQQLRLLSERGTSAEWKIAINEEAAIRLEKKDAKRTSR